MPSMTYSNTHNSVRELSLSGRARPAILCVAWFSLLDWHSTEDIVGPFLPGAATGSPSELIRVFVMSWFTSARCNQHCAAQVERSCPPFWCSPEISMISTLSTVMHPLSMRPIAAGRV